MAIEAVLFDADGVIQRPAPERPGLLCSALGCSLEALPAWQSELFAIEETALTGRADFASEVATFLTERGCPGTVEEILAAWTAIRVERAIRVWIRGLRGRGIRCFLATNQERERGTWMSSGLDSARLFEAEFYSHALGVAKPPPAYFRRIIQLTGIAPARTLFVDDRLDNVVAARSVGLAAEQVDFDTVVATVEAATR